MALEYPVTPPSPPRSPVPRSSLQISTTIEDSSISFIPMPTPRSGSFPSLSPVLSKPPPAIPPKWLWRCHLCGLAYPLGTTRRCLNDGHYFCAGTTVSKKTGKRRTHAPCGSTFDYFGWQKYGDWRRRELKLRTIVGSKSASSIVKKNQSGTYLSKLASTKQTQDSHEEEEELQPNSSAEDTDESDTGSPIVPQSPEKPSDCEQQCNYPSECRWGKTVSPAKEKKKRKTNKKAVSSSTSPDEATFTSNEKDLQPLKTSSTHKPTSKQQTSPQPQPQPAPKLSSIKEFRLEAGSLRRNQSFSLPFASYSWLGLSAAAPTSPPSPPVSEVFDPIEISRARDAVRKDSWPLRTLAFPLLGDSLVELDSSTTTQGSALGAPDLPALPRTSFRHRLPTPGTTPGPVERMIPAAAGAAVAGDCETGSGSGSGSETDASSAGSRSHSPTVFGSASLFEWNWNVGGWPDAWDRRRFGMAGELL